VSAVSVDAELETAATGTAARPVQPRLRLGISACLFGQKVRYDGGHKLDAFLVHTLGRYVEWVPVCPEVEMGLPVPRETMSLAGDPESPRLVTTRTGTDYTDRMQCWAGERLQQLAGLGLSGFVFKKGSPSCGLLRVRVRDDTGVPAGTGRGLFAAAFAHRFPHPPVEEEGRLLDVRLRESFIERIFAYERLRPLLEAEGKPADLVRFHSAHKMTLLAHSPRHYQELGRLVAQAGSLPWDELIAQYAAGFTEGMKRLATPGKHANVLQHLLGFLKDSLDAGDKAEMLELIADYRRGLVPLIVPVRLLKRHLARHPVPEWLHEQVYLNPDPAELMLRNHV